MLYQLGALTIKHAPFNVDAVGKNSATDFVQKPVAGAAKPLEYVGEGKTTMTLSGTLFPKAIGGKTELGVLEMMRMSAMPHFLLRGDGAPLGWFYITSVSTSEKSLARDGVGQVVGVSISLTRAPAPAALSIVGVILGMF